MEHEDANAQVDAFLHILFIRFGVSESDLKQWIHYLPAVIESHQKSVRYGELVAKTLIGSLVASMVIAIFGAIGWSVVHFVQSVNGL